MMRSMTRWVLTKFMALATFAVLAVGPATADAAPDVSPFAGSYAWGSVTVSISNRGRISGAGSSADYSMQFDESISGNVGADGIYSFTKKTTIWGIDFFGKRHRLATISYAYAGTMAPDAEGNIVGTGDTGGSFLWLRQ